jgi:hypothetical protein
MADSGAPDAIGANVRQESSRVIRAIGLSVGPAAAPFAAAALLPEMGAAVLAVELVLTLLVFGIAVYGTQEQADRVFRLLRWLYNRPEPPAPPSLRGKKAPLPPLRRRRQSAQITAGTMEQADPTAEHPGE